MVLRSYITQRNPCINPPDNISGEQDELAGAKSDAGSNEAPTPPEAPTLSLFPPPTKDLFTKFMKVFMKTTQAQAQALADPRERQLKARIPETYWGKFHIECYHFCQQCEDHFKTLGATGINCIPFVASFLHSSISIR